MNLLNFEQFYSFQVYTTHKSQNTNIYEQSFVAKSLLTNHTFSYSQEAGQCQFRMNDLPFFISGSNSPILPILETSQTTHPTPLPPPIHPASRNNLSHTPQSPRSIIKVNPIRKNQTPDYFDESELTRHKTNTFSKEFLSSNYQQACSLLNEGKDPQKALAMLHTFVTNEKDDYEKLGIAWNAIGRLYHYGHGVEQDLEEARCAYVKAYKYGISISEYHLGTLYATSSYSNYNLNEALNHFLRYVKLGGWAGHYQMGMILLSQNKPLEALQNFQACIDQSKLEKSQAELDYFEEDLKDAYAQVKKIDDWFSSKEPMELSEPSDAVMPSNEFNKQERLGIQVLVELLRKRMLLY